MEGRRSNARYFEDSCRVRAFKAKGKGSSTQEAPLTAASVPMPPGKALESRPATASTHVQGGSYSEAERERGLVALAVCSGNSRRAARLLAHRGLPIPRSTLKQWPDLYPGQYGAVQTRILPELKARLAEEHTALAEDLMDLSREMAGRLLHEYSELPVRDLSSGIRNASVASAVHSDKARDLRGDPTAVVEHRSVEEIERPLRALGIVIEGTAEEIPDSGVDPAEAQHGEHWRE